MRRLLILTAMLVAAPTQAAVERIEITERVPLADGAVFGAAGAYEKIRGKAYIALDPAAKANANIVDLKLAPRDAKGRVLFSTDFLLLRPADPAKRNGALIYDVNNRGNIALLGQANGKVPAHNDPTTLADTGNGFLFKRGFTMLFSAWTWDVQPGGPGDKPFIFQPPIATENGKTITGKTAYEFIVDAPSKTATYVGRNGTPYKFATPGAPDAVLTERDSPEGVRRPIPRSAWRFVDNGDRLPIDVSMDAGFKTGRIYEIVLTSKDPYVVGTGLAGIRDLMSHFKQQPVAGQPALERAHIFGISQSGRVIDTMLYLGMNRDEAGRAAFDGAYSHVPGAGRGAFNQRFGMATRHFKPLVEFIYESDVFPMTIAPSREPLTGATGSMIDGARKGGPLPKMIFANTSAEYWNRAASLLHTTPDGNQDVAVDPAARVYFLAGSQHYVGRSRERAPLSSCVNTTNHYPVQRALIVALDDWVTGKASPPESAVPTLAGGTLLNFAAYKAAFKAPQLTPPVGPMTPPRLDHGPRFAQGIADVMPPKMGAPYITTVPAPDADGNDRGGVRQIELEAPLGTHTGWNLRAPETGFGEYQGSFDGSFVPFARTEAERAARNDPRPSIAARYPTKDAYLAKVRAAANAEAKAGFILAEEIDALVAAQGATYDRVMAHDPADQSCKYLFAD